MKNYIYLISIIILVLAWFYISWFIGLVQLGGFMIFYSFIFYVFYYAYKKIYIFCFKKEKDILHYRIFLENFTKKISLSIIIISLIIFSFWYYQIYIAPAKMLEYHISNGKKQVVFQEMSHIWTGEFYEKIRDNLAWYKKNSFVYFYEGVRPGKNENNNKFNELIWIKFDENLYKNFSKLYWVTFQDNSIYMWLVNDLDFNVDVWIDWIIKEYKKIWEKNYSLSENKDINEKKEVVDLNKQILDSLSKLNEKQLKILVFVNKSILNFLIKNDRIQNFVKDEFTNKNLFKIILEWRNNVLAQEIINTKYDKIYVTYWKLHFHGVFELLKISDKNWKIVGKREFVSVR